ncbi:MAG: hypothetical protein A2Z20_00940 [Bdellovibrionales bacterium RBG_16_40_8]|nr:MAG: hypothetical protein A2Z20_00940 [Bdellovibrionales bacterium RBG_16_40_8]
MLVTCLIVVFGTLILNGSFLHLWNLHHNSRNLSERINNLRTNSQKIEEKIIKARDPNFIEVEAREKFDLAGEGDLVFIFSDDD